MSFKTLHSFEIPIDQEVTKTETRTENGQTITVSSKVVEPVPHTIVLKDLSRGDKQSQSLWYGKQYNEAINIHGLSPRMLLIQKFSRSPDSPLSQDEDKNLGKMYDQLNEFQNDLTRSQALPENDDTKDKRVKLILEIQTLNKRITDIESSYQSLFANTAEVYAQNRALTWLILNMTFIKKDGKEVAMFSGKTFEEKENDLFGMEEREDKLLLASIEKISFYWMLYLVGKVKTTEDYLALEKEMKKQLEGDEDKSNKDENKKTGRETKNE